MKWYTANFQKQGMPVLWKGNEWYEAKKLGWESQLYT